MRILHQPLLGIILVLGHVYVVHTMHMSVLKQNCTDICFESWWWGSWHPHLRNLSTQAGRQTNPQMELQQLWNTIWGKHCTHYVVSWNTFLQRPKKSELSGWQLSTRKNFPDEVRKSFSRQKKRVNRFRNKKMRKSFSQQIKCVNLFATKKTRKSFSR